MKRYDVLIVGDLCGLDALFAEHLSRFELRVCVLRRREIRKQEHIDNTKNYFTHFNSNDIKVISNQFDFLYYVYKSRLIVSFTASLLGYMRCLFLIKTFLFLPPVIHISTGSDMSELMMEKTLRGFLYRRYLKFVDVIYSHPYPHILNNSIDIKIKKFYFARSFPWYVLSPLETKRKDNDELVFFHFSHLDWKETDNKPNRNSTKGNDKFIRAFIRALGEGLNAKCIILDRGPDRHIAKKMISNSLFSDRFIWKPHLTRDELMEIMGSSDVLVDQFDVGGFGMGAIEGMSLQKPVMIYINLKAYKTQYGANLPPILNCCTEDEIFERIMQCKNRDYLCEVGLKAREWVVRNHQWDNCMDDFLFHYQRLTGHRIINYLESK